MKQDHSPIYPLRCPVCGTSMVGEKTDPKCEDFDLHRCLSCGATISTPAGRVKRTAADEERAEGSRGRRAV